MKDLQLKEMLELHLYSGVAPFMSWNNAQLTRDNGDSTINYTSHLIMAQWHEITKCG